MDGIMSTVQALVAVIDDDPEMRAALSRLLSARGFRVKTFDAAETFLVHASRCEAVCLIVDIQLRDISGIELAHQLAADGLSFQIIFMTGNHDATIEQKAIAAGGVACLRKPFSAEEFMNLLNTAVGGSR
jgi:FixJ family two-component response regulator